MDGQEINTSNYTAVSGSTVVTLKQSYLNTLGEGNHSLVFVYTDGTIDTPLSVAKVNVPTVGQTDTNPKDNNGSVTPNTDVKENSTSVTTDINTNNNNRNATSVVNKTVNNPKTGDNIIIWISLLLLSILGMGYIGKRYNIWIL